MHPQLTVDDGLLGLPDRAGTDRVVVRRCGGLDERAHRRVVIDGGARREFLGAPGVERPRGPDLTRDPEALEHGFHIAFVAKVIRVDERRRLGAGSGQPD